MYMCPEIQPLFERLMNEEQLIKSCSSTEEKERRVAIWRTHLEELEALSREFQKVKMGVA